MADYIPKFQPGQAVTYVADADVTGGRLVEVTGDRAVSPAGADSTSVVGVAGRDTKAGDHVVVYGATIHTLPAAGAVEAGSRVAAGAAGTVSASGDNQIALALTSAAQAGDVIEVRLDN